MKLCRIPLKLSLLLFPFVASSQYLQVDDTYSAQALVEDVLIGSPCANVSNITVSGDTFSGNQNSYGYFTRNSSDFPFENGIVLSTARAKRSEGPNNNLIDEGSTQWGSDPDLEQALGFQGEMINATSIEFDFTPLTSEISFDYIFASEEYHGTAQCIYSDGFAFLLRPADGSQPYQNLAIIPGSNTPVSVTSVRPAVPGACPAVNQQFFGQYNGSNSAINYNGQTTVLTARATVTPGVTYHIKLVIADHHNYRYDSAVFLAGGSFTVGTDLGPDRLVATANPVCEGDTYVLSALEPGATGFQWRRNDQLIPGATSAQYTVTEAGIYSVEVTLGTTGCVATGEVIIEYAPVPDILPDYTLVQCDPDGDGTASFNLTTAGAQITSQTAGQLNIRYFQSLSDAENGANPIMGPQSYISAAPGQVFIRVENQYNCASYATVDLTFADNSVQVPGPVSACDSDGDGIATFSLAQAVTPQILAGLPAGLTVTYYVSLLDADLATNALPDNFTTTVAGGQTIYARIINGPECYGVIPVSLKVEVFNSVGLAPQTAFICAGASVTISAPPGYQTYVWNTGSGSQQLTVGTAGVYTVTVTDANGCTGTKQFTVVESSAAIVDDVVVKDFSAGRNTVTIIYSGSGNYEFSLDGLTYSPSPVFENVAPGVYEGFVRDINGCGVTGPFQIVVMDYPRFFTPNADGHNDVWYVKNLYRFPGASLNIFNRYGKLLYSFRNGDDYWDGRKDGADLPSDDYWFVLGLDGGKTVKGHFSLKR